MKTFLGNLTLNRKVTFLMFFLVLTFVFSQNLFAQQVNLSGKTTSVKEVMSQIERQTGYKFFYNSTTIDVNRFVTIKEKKISLQRLLTKLFVNTNVSYKIMDKNIVLNSKSSSDSDSGLKSYDKDNRQKHKISGKVIDASGEPIIGATVRESGTNNIAVTDIDGNYTLMVSSMNSKIDFSYIGYDEQVLSLNGRYKLNSTLHESNKALNEVVVVGYGTMRKSDLTGSVVRANIKDFEDVPNTNLGQMLQGTIPGLNVGQTTTTGVTPSLSIRGDNTLSGNSNVLIVLDGIIYTSPLSSINPNDVESVDVLKDASATAVYGAQAANGVILITTKKGKKGKTRVNFSTSYSFSTPTKNYKPMNREEFLQYTRDYWYDKAYLGPDYTTPNPDFDIAGYLPDTPMKDSSQPDGVSANDYSWFDNGTQTGHIFENRLSVSGGNDKMSFLMSYENTNQEGFIKNDIFKRNGVRINLDVTPNDWLKFGAQTFASFINQDGDEPDWWGLLVGCPLIKPYKEDGSLVPYPFETLETNPFMGSDVSDKERHNYFFGNLYAEVKLPIKGLTYRVNFGNNYRLDNHYYASKYAASLNGEAYKHHSQYYDYTVDNFLNYSLSFGKNAIAATLLYGVSERKYDYTSADATNFARLTLGYNNLGLGTNQYTNSNAWNEALLYQMGRINYRYDNKYLLTATIRRDGYSGFAKNNKFAIFPSVALGWNISEEKFFNVSWIDRLKIRAGWGISGNQTNRYKSLSKVNSYPAYVFGDGGSTLIGQEVVSMSNSDLKWEKTSGINFGLDLSILKNRIDATLDIYFNTTKDLLYDLAIPTITGFSSVSTNIGKLRNHGIEFTINSRNILTKDFEWSTSFNISANKNKIVTLTGQDLDGDGKEDDLVASNLFMGKDISSIYGYKIDGIWQLDDDIPTGYHPGNYRIVDTTKDGKITTDDRVIIGKATPAYRFGILNTFRYKNIKLSFFINSVQGGKNGYLGVNDQTIVRGNATSLRWNRVKELAFDYWSPSNPNAHYSRSIQRGVITPTRYMDRSFVRLQDVSLSYTFPRSLTSRIGLENLYIFFSGKNLITITDWKGWDPEANSGWYGRPVLKDYSLGLNLTF